MMTRLTNLIANPFRALLIVCAVMLLCFTFGNGVAANETGDRKFSRKIGKATVEALDLINRQDYEAATLKLESLLKKKKLSSYERSTILQINGQALYELKQPQRAIEAFESAIAEGGLLPREERDLRQNIAMLHISEAEYERGAEMLEQWEHDGNTLTPVHLDLLMNAWTLSKNYERALPWVEQWFENSNPKERKHYDLLHFIYENLGQSEKQMNLLQVMDEKWPNDDVIQMYLKPPPARPPTRQYGIPNFLASAPKNRGSFKITVSDRDAQPIVRIPPSMPPSATTSGDCDVRFNVTIEGRPIDVKTTSCTDYVFEMAAIESVEMWKFNPKIRDGKAMTRTGVETKIRFLTTDTSK